MTKQSALPDFIPALQKQISGELRTDIYSRILYSTDASIYQVLPHGVLIPKSIEDIQAAVELAGQYQVPILPRAGGSSLAGQTVNEALVIDTTRHLDGVVEINREEKWCRVQPGIVLDELNIKLHEHGLQFGPDPASSNRAAMGGIVANNSTGSHSILYGMTADHVMETGVILSDGTMARFGPLTEKDLQQRLHGKALEGQIYDRIHTLVTQQAGVIREGTPRHWRRCNGYNLDRFVAGTTYTWPHDPSFNLAKLVCGSEGTLGVITEIKLNLVPRPEKTALAIIHFDSLYEALSAVPVILEAGPSAVELLDNLALTMCRKVPQYARLLQTFVEGEPFCLLITEFYGSSESELQSKVEALQLHLRRQKQRCQVVKALDPQQQNNVWTVRKVGLGLLMSVKGDHKPIPFIEDAAVPVEHLAEYVTKIEQFCHERGTDVAYYAHASAGCIHIRPMINTKEAKEVAKLPEIGMFSMDLVKGYQGAISSEHGYGRTRSWLVERFFGTPMYGLFKEVKQVFDPLNILNPGNIIDAHDMKASLRFGADYQTLPYKESIDFSDDLGFDRAVEMCNGAGICRKRTTGTMCPSFIATREEEHSTRGRANALRAVLSGRLPAKELASERMYQVMELCVSCKACKAECPSSVDMAKIKFEFLANYHNWHGVKLRDRLFGNIALLNKTFSGWPAPLLNWVLQTGLSKWQLEKFLGVTRERNLPPFARVPFTVWFKKHRRSDGPHSNQVVLFNDPFTTYNDPQVAIAATEVLEAAGFAVVLAGIECCGRPMISKGLVEEAREVAQDTVTRLTPFAEKAIPIVGLEPSSLLTMRDEYHYLLPRDKRVELVAKHCYTFEEFIADLADRGQLNLQFTDAKRQLLLHGHCHQKALVGSGPSKTMLALPPNYVVEEIDSSCCGMAGSFGYEAEHYEISLKMAEHNLAPAIRAAGADTIIVAAGTSCRHQISHTTGRTALHPAEVIRAALT
jgi:FAD/FMN-containing dehydrogenase/Fe-S oxidoreductase